MRRAASVAALLLSSTLPAFAADQPSSCVALTDDAARLACYDAAFGRGEAPMPVAAAPRPEQSFGAEQLPQSGAEKTREPDSMQVHIDGNFEGWDPKTRFKLDNGQVWEVTGDNSVYYKPTPNPEVTIEKGMFGSYFLRVDGLNSRAKIKRIK